MKIFDKSGELIVDLEKRPLSYSSLKEFAKSPAHFVQYIREKPERTAEMLFGSIVDVLTLTPDEFDKEFVLIPDDAPKRPTKAQRNAKKPSPESIASVQYWDKFDEENKGKAFIDREDLELATQVSDAVQSNEPAMRVLNEITQTQSLIRWVDKATGVPMIAKLDGEGDVCSFDLKTSANGDPDEFIRSALRLKYHWQTAIYLDALRVKRFKFPDFYFVVAEKVAPFSISVFKATEDFIDLGRKQYRETLTAFKYCYDNNLWHQGYEFRAPAGYHQLDLPNWMKRQIDE